MNNEDKLETRPFSLVKKQNKAKQTKKDAVVNCVNFGNDGFYFHSGKCKELC